MTVKRTVAIVAVIAALFTGVAAALEVIGGRAAGGAEVSQEVPLKSDDDTMAATTAPRGTGEAITVHGHWIIEVREPDGALAARREFDNRLMSDGGRTLARLLARETSIGLWEILLNASGSAPVPCLNSTGGAVRCRIVESASSETEPNYFKTLTVS